MFIIKYRKRRFEALIAKLAMSSQACGKNKALDKCGIAGRKIMADAFEKDQTECLRELYSLLGHRYK